LKSSIYQGITQCQKSDRIFLHSFENTAGGKLLDHRGQRIWELPEQEEAGIPAQFKRCWAEVGKLQELMLARG
jgi:hypothetical protein